MADETMRALHPTVRDLWRLRSLLLGLPGIIAAVVLAIVPAPAWAVWTAVTVTVVSVGAGLWWASRRFARFGYRLTDEVVHVRDGVLTHLDAAVPLFRVQHIDVGRDPLERLLDLATLTIHTAAPDADVVLPGIAADEAATVRDEILTAAAAAARRHGVVDVDAV